MDSKIIGMKPWDDSAVGSYPARIVLLEITKGNHTEYSTHMEVDPSKEGRENYFISGHYFIDLEGARIDFNKREVTTLPKEKAKAIIYICGGLVDSIVSDTSIEILIVDGDTDGADEDEMSVINGEEVVCHGDDALVDKEKVEKAFKDYYKRD